MLEVVSNAEDAARFLPVVIIWENRVGVLTNLLVSAQSVARRQIQKQIKKKKKKKKKDKYKIQRPV